MGATNPIWEPQILMILCLRFRILACMDIGEYKSRMDLGQLFISKIYKKFNFEDKNIEKYSLFGKIIFLLWKYMHLYIAVLQIIALP
jgi:hypothetical protein